VAALYYIRNSEHRPQKDFAINNENQSLSSNQLQQQELVSFLYHRFRFGIFITLFVSSLTSILAYVELSIQGRGHWVIGWFLLLLGILIVRWRGLNQFLNLDNKAYFPYQIWHTRFYIGASLTGLMLGLGAALLMPYITLKLQIILHSLLLVMAAGAIAYLSTSLRVYITYLLTIMMPVTVWLFLQNNSETYLLSFLYLFFMTAGFISVKRMSELLNNALYYRYDNETLVDDLQRLLQSVSQNNKALEKISLTDELTGVASYRAFRVHLEEIWNSYHGNNLPVSLLKLNIDYYHEFNAHHGQQAADRYLGEIARLLSDQVSHQSQMVARLHGAEFALLLPGVSCAEARQIAKQVIKGLADKKIEHRKSPIGPLLTMSVGLGSQTVRPGASSGELLVRVDTALKLATEKGHNRLEVLEA